MEPVDNDVDALDAFALPDEIVQLREDQSGNEESLPFTWSEDIGYLDVVRVFPMTQLARRVNELQARY